VDTNRKKTNHADAARSDSERRRIGTVVHDDRGNASVKWRDAPPELIERPVLEVLGEHKLTLKNDETFDPYARRTLSEPKRKAESGARTDLRKLSEWIKMMRELEERKRRDGD
jgi:hypothetical protein